MRAKIVKESLTESIKIQGHIYDQYKLGPHETIIAGKDGILGKGDSHIPWEMIKKLMIKYNIL